MRCTTWPQIAIAMLLACSTTAAAQPSLTLDEAARVAFKGSLTRETERGTLDFEAKKLVPVGKYQILISEGTNQDECHACSGALSVHYLELQNGKWMVKREWLDKAGGGSFGVPASEWSVSTSLLSSPVLYSEGGGTWQGCTSSMASVLPLLPEGLGAETDIPIFFDYNGPASDLQSAKGKITAIQKGRGFSVQFTGRKKGRNWSAIDRYKWNGKAFQIVGKRSLETC